MDFTSDFSVPPRLSQIIESDSDDPGDEKSNKESFASKDQSEPSSPVFRKYRTSSPVFSHGKKRSSSGEKTHKIARRSLNLDFFKSLEREEENDDIYVGDNDLSSDESEGGCVSGEVLTETSSQAVSSCQSSIGTRPQPIEDTKPFVTVTASSLYGHGDLQDDDEVFESSDSDIPPDNILNSGKKKKPVKGGLVEQLEKILQQKSSREHLEKYQTELGNTDGEVTMSIVGIDHDDDNLILHGASYDVLVNTEFCPDPPGQGDTISFYHPKTYRYINGKKILFGVFKLKIIAKLAEEEPNLEVNEVAKTSETNLRCPCLCGGTCLSSENFYLINYFCENSDDSLSSSTKDDSTRSIPSSPSNNLLKVTVSKLVNILGGTSSSPQNSFRLCRKLKFSSEFLIHRIFFQESLNFENHGQRYRLTLLCEDRVGEFVLVRIDSTHSNDGNWKLLFENWESMMGRKITLWSPFHIQNRYTRSQNYPLFNTISAICETNQRFCYVFQVFPGSRVDIEAEAMSTMKILDGLPVKSNNQQRVNLNVTVIHIPSDKKALYMVPASKPSSYRLITVGKSFVHDKFFQSDSCPCQCVIVGLLQKPCCSLSLDGFSSIIRMKKTEIDLGFLPVRSGVSKVGDLVKIEGMVTRVNQQASLQWMECDLCRSDEMEDPELGPGAGTWRCISCGHSGARHRIELVCKVANWWVRLGKSATKVLPNDKLKSFHPADVIGQVFTHCLNGNMFGSLLNAV